MKGGDQVSPIDHHGGVKGFGLQGACSGKLDPPQLFRQEGLAAS